MAAESASPAEPRAATAPKSLDHLIEALAGPDRRVVVRGSDGVRRPVAAFGTIAVHSFEEQDGDGNDLGWEEVVVALTTAADMTDAISRRLEAALRKALADGARGRLAVAIVRDGFPDREMIAEAAVDDRDLVLTSMPRRTQRAHGGSDAGARQLGSGEADGGFCVPRLPDGSEPMKTRRS